MKKYVIAMLGIVALLLVIAYVMLFMKQSTYHKKIAASSSSVLVLSNFDRAKVKVVTTSSDKIELNLKGPTEDILSILQRENGIYTTLEFSDELSEITGTIAVPQGMLLDVSLSGGRFVTIDDIGGKKSIAAEDSFLVDTSNLSAMVVDDQGNISLSSPGDLIVWDDEEWDPLDGNVSEESQGIVYCGIGAQSIRNYCCELENADEEVPACNGIGYWFFNNSARDCDFACEASDSGSEVVEEIDCGVGGQVERNMCCASQHVGEYQGCIGSWRYNAAAQVCEFKCDVVDGAVGSNDDGGGGDGGTFSYGDPVSDYCSGIISDENRDLCCNDALKNNLSSGPHPGFPDCIGKWKFDVQLGCKFECAEHAEMMEILNELKQKAQQQN
ncbi:hypothetical protein JXD20_04230 [Candidatus Peregrinibacteria bacterium]|nr:hypothetical protein [Candidatus Peregrinibacteria bacterium]